MRRTASHAEDRAQEPQFPQGALPSEVVAAFWKTMQPNDARRERPGLRLTLRALVGLDRFANDSPLEEDGFELLVPRKTPDVVAGAGSCISCRLFLVGRKLEDATRRRS
jgi:hypothetical protein